MLCLVLEGATSTSSNPTFITTQAGDYEESNGDDEEGEDDDDEYTDDALLSNLLDHDDIFEEGELKSCRAITIATPLVAHMPDCHR